MQFLDFGFLESAITNQTKDKFIERLNKFTNIKYKVNSVILPEYEEQYLKKKYNLTDDQIIKENIGKKMPLRDYDPQHEA